MASRRNPYRAGSPDLRCHLILAHEGMIATSCAREYRSGALGALEQRERGFRLKVMNQAGLRRLYEHAGAQIAPLLSRILIGELVGIERAHDRALDAIPETHPVAAMGYLAVRVSHQRRRSYPVPPWKTLGLR